MEPDELLIRLTRIEDKLDSHLSEHKFKFNLLTKAIIPGTSILVSAISALATHLWGRHHG